MDRRMYGWMNGKAMIWDELLKCKGVVGVTDEHVTKLCLMRMNGLVECMMEEKVNK